MWQNYPDGYKLENAVNKLSVIALVCLLAGCAATPQRLDWPDLMPPKSYYVAYYEADKLNQQDQAPEEYLTWNIRFYQGWTLYRRGWNQLMDEVDEALQEPEQRTLAREKMLSIGKRVSAEWSKADPHRRINTSNVGVWGNALLESFLYGDTMDYIDKVSTDVDQLLSGALTASDITPDRYYEEDPDDVFR